MFILFTILTLFIKEDAALYLIIFGIYMYFDGNKKKGIITTIGSLVYFLLALYILKNYGDGIMTDRYNNLIYNDIGPFGIIKTLIVNPSYFLNQIIFDFLHHYF